MDDPDDLLFDAIKLKDYYSPEEQNATGVEFSAKAQKDKFLSSGGSSPETRSNVAISMLQRKILALGPLAEEYDALKTKELQESRWIVAGREVELATPTHELSPTYVEGFDALPKSVQETTAKMMREINAKRGQQGLPALEAHGTDRARFIGMLEKGAMDRSHFGSFEISYNPEELRGFFDEQPVWVIKPANIDTFPIPLNQLTFIFPHPKGEIKILNSVVDKLRSGSLKGVGTHISSLREFGQYMSTNQCKLPAEVNPPASPTPPSK
ncbi:hypothetical protein HY439_02045 [Candidatus Microgenomates bacterium]|nr:hypothetical protein [Candidatus Microgenomates bacterium]